MKDQPRRLAPAMSLMLVVLGAPGACSKRQAKADASADASSVASAAAAASSSAALAEARASAAASAAAAKAAAAKAAAVDQAKTRLADIKWLISHGVSVNPAKTGDGDVVSKCDEAEAARSSLGDAGADLRPILDETAALCAFDVPLLTASEAIDHMRLSPSQASRLLMCDVSAREIARARTAKPNHPRVHAVTARRSAVCQ